MAIVDYVYQRFSFMKQMRMTRQELRDELKQSDGDPQIKSRIRRLQQERARKRMMAAVPGATVVITNPTHYAVALAYEMKTMAAPKVVAKGVDVLARRIRELPRPTACLLLANPPLARALHGSVEVDDEIGRTLSSSCSDHRIRYAGKRRRSAGQIIYKRRPQGPDVIVRMSSA